MIAVHSKILFIIFCFIETIWLLLAQVSGNMILLIPCLIIFLLLAVLAATQKMAIPMLMFFLPFAPLLKLQPGTISFYTIALLAVYLVYLVFGSRNINIFHIIPGLLLIAFTLVIKILYNYQIDNSYILFSVSLLLVPFLVTEFSEKYDFYWLTLFFTIGIAMAAITSLFLTDFPTIGRYIDDYELFGVVRHSGYYGDPNFYSAHISAALGGVLILLLNTSKKNRIILLVLMLVLLLYCGFLGVSKSFFLITLCELLIFGLAFLFKKGKLSLKLLLLLTITLGILFLLSSTVFTELIDMMLFRFSQGTNFSDFTTGRTELWSQYLRAFTEDPLLLLFGKGYTGVNLNGRASHSSIIQGIYQFGIIGCVFLVVWIICYVRTLLYGTKARWKNPAQICILLIGTIGPWIALDLLFFDEFFLIPIYVCIGIRSLTNKVPLEEESFQ